MKHSTRVSVVAAFALALAAGCSKDKGKEAGEASAPDPAAKVTAPPATPEPAPPPPAASAPTVKLLEPGAEPRAALRLAPKKGDRQTVQMSMKLDMEMSLNGNAMPKVALPVTIMTMQVEVVDVTADGNIKWEMKVVSADVLDDPNVMPQVIATTRSALAGLKDFGGWAIVDPRGFIKEADISLPPNADPQMKQMMEGMRQSLDQMTAPLPEEPIGAGARWQVDQTISQQGMTILQTATYKVVSIDGGRVKCDVEVKQTAPRQRMDVPGVPPGMSAELVSLTSTGSGTTELDLARVVPPSGAISASMEMKTQVTGGGQSQSMDMKLGMSMNVAEQK